ncbi:MAG: DnaJ domain-containing protein [Cyclobacteriaceae bacterium]
MNHYQVLGLTPTAGNAEIKEAYREMVKKYHPDINPAPEANERIRLINEAYEVLSDYHSRSHYNQSISSSEIRYYKETEEDRYKREYLRKKAHNERIRMENLIRLKFKVYRVERIFCMLFFLQGIIYTLDYYILPYKTTEVINSIRSNEETSRIKTSVGDYQTDKEIHYESRRISMNKIEVIRSGIFKVPASINLQGSENQYRVYRTLRSFYNVFSIIILFFSAIVINNREYTDFRLTCGIVPAFLSLFLFLYVLINT